MVKHKEEINTPLINDQQEKQFTLHVAETNLNTIPIQGVYKSSLKNFQEISKTHLTNFQ